MIFKRVGDGRPYPDHGLTGKGWAAVPPRQVRLADLVTTKSALDLDTLLAEDGRHRAVRAALHQRSTLHARVYELEDR